VTEKVVGVFVRFRRFQSLNKTATLIDTKSCHSTEVDSYTFDGDEKMI
jgi:hypothetical protein